MAMRPSKPQSQQKGKMQKKPNQPQPRRSIAAAPPRGRQAPVRGKGGGAAWEKQLEQIKRDAYLAGIAAARQSNLGKHIQQNRRGSGPKSGGAQAAGKRLPWQKPIVQQPAKQQPAKQLSKHQLKLQKVPVNQLVWIGGLSPKTSWKTLEKHLAEVIKPKIVEVINKNPKKPVTAKVAFASEDDVQTIVDSLNGSELDGCTLEVDTWTKSDKSERPKRRERTRKRGRGGKKEDTKSKLSKVLNTKFAKAAREKASKGGKEKKTSKIGELMRTTDASCKVWVGGLSEKTTWKQLEKHFAEVAKPKATEIMKKGTAVLAYENENDVSTVISALNGTELNGKTLEVDVWVKPDRSERRQRRKKGEKKDEKKE